MEGLREEEGVLHFLLRKKQIQAPFLINMRRGRKRKDQAPYLINMGRGRKRKDQAPFLINMERGRRNRKPPIR